VCTSVGLTGPAAHPACCVPFLSGSFCLASACFYCLFEAGGYDETDMDMIKPVKGMTSQENQRHSPGIFDLSRKSNRWVTSTR